MENKQVRSGGTDSAGFPLVRSFRKIGVPRTLSTRRSEFLKDRTTSAWANTRGTKTRYVFAAWFDIARRSKRCTGRFAVLKVDRVRAGTQ